ncbi:hypothetical protein Tco_0471823 [Tanacetum coccineum]
MMNTKCNHSKGDMKVEAKSSSSVLMVDSITFGQEMVNILVSGEEYDKVFNHLDMLNAPLEGKIITTAKNEDMFGVNDLESDKIVVESQVANKDMNLSVDEVTLAQALVSIVIPTTAATTITAVSSRPRAKGIVFVSSQQPTQVKDKAKVKADYQLAQRLQAQEQEELSDAEKDTLFVQLLEKRRKHFVAKRAEKKRNIPPTKAQQRSFMCTYLKNMEGWKPKDLNNKSFANIQDLFDKAMKRVNIFVDMDTELVKESSKKAEAETTQMSKLAQRVLEIRSSGTRKL